MDSTKIESGVQLFSRLNQRASVVKLNTVLFPTGPFGNELIEITGATMTGKTTLVTDLIARCILPSQHFGKNCGAVLLNTDHQFDTLKLITVMEVLIKKSTNRLDLDVENIIKSSLLHLTILNCYDGQQMQLTFLSLEKLLCENLNIGLIVLDSISAYYWEYRLSKGIISFQQYHLKVLDSLKESIKNSNVVAAFTRSDVGPISEKESYSLKASYKITLKEADDKFAAVITNNTKNVSNIVYYKIGVTINFL